MLKLNPEQVVVLGDVIVDRYWYGSTERISPEAPVPITHVQSSQDKAGGAANVALNLQALGCVTTLIGIVGNDNAGSSIANILAQSGVIDQLHRVDGIDTITKIRLVTNNQQLIRADFEQPLFSHVHGLTRYLHHIANAKVMVLSDYNKGTLHNCKELIALAQQHAIPVLVDPKGNNFERYTGATLLTPNLKEFEAIVGKSSSDEDIINKASQLIAKLNLQAILITLSEHGMLLVYRNNEASDYQSIHYPTRALEVFDVTGAGDTVMATLAAGVASGYSLVDAVHLANVAASVAVAKSGTAVVTHAELAQALALENKDKLQLGVVSVEHLLHQLQIARTNNDTIVMTNGCFDILHAGHVKYLEQAAELGDRLIVAINTDESITHLKGESRPVYPLEQRLAMLAALKSVSWVVVFEGDTPEELLKLCRPDILVKGGDYKDITEVVGHEIVTEYGGQVKIMEHIPSCSTSSTIDSLLNS